MTNDLDTLLTALYVEIDDHVVPARRGRGRRPRLTDAELVCLAVAQVLLGIDGEHRWIRFAYCRLGHLFRYLPKQPGYHKRLIAAAPLLAAAKVRGHAVHFGTHMLNGQLGMMMQFFGLAER